MLLGQDDGFSHENMGFVGFAISLRLFGYSLATLISEFLTMLMKLLALLCGFDLVSNS